MRCWCFQEFQHLIAILSLGLCSCLLEECLRFVWIIQSGTRNSLSLCFQVSKNSRSNNNWYLTILQVDQIHILISVTFNLWYLYYLHLKLWLIRLHVYFYWSWNDFIVDPTIIHTHYVVCGRGSGAVPASRYQKVTCLILLVRTSRWTRARYWTPNCAINVWITIICKLTYMVLLLQPRGAGIQTSDTLSTRKLLYCRSYSCPVIIH